MTFKNHHFKVEIQDNLALKSFQDTGAGLFKLCGRDVTISACDGTITPR